MSADRVAALATWAAELLFEDLPVEVVERVRNLVLDHVGVAMAGAQRPHSEQLQSLEGRLGGDGASTVLGTSQRLDLDRAAFLNAVAGSSGPNLDDVCHGSLGHPGVGTIPSALVVGESAGAPGTRFVEAVVVGYEVTMRIGEVIGRSAFDRGFHPRGGCNAMSSAVASLKVRGVQDPGAYVTAMGHAANSTGGLVGASYFADAWYLLSGIAARTGVLAAEQTLAGLTAADGALDGPSGYFRATSDQVLDDALTHGLGDGYRLLDAGQKLYPSSGATHAALEAALEAHRRIGCPGSDLAAVNIFGFRQMAGALGRPFPDTVVGATMSTPYVVACALRDGDFWLEHLDTSVMQDADLRRLQALITLTVDDRLDTLPPRHLGARVQVVSRTGRQETVEVLTASGHPGNPLTREQLRHKVNRLLGSSRISVDLPAVESAVLGLPATTPADILAESRPVP